MRFSIELVSHLNTEWEVLMEEDLSSHAHHQGVALGCRFFYLVLRDELPEPIGILIAYEEFGDVTVDNIWVHSNHRGHGHGRCLLDAMEAHCRVHHFHNINLVTYQFQAPEFYKKCGYELEFVRANSTNPKLTKFFFVKSLDLAQNPEKS